MGMSTPKLPSDAALVEDDLFVDDEEDAPLVWHDDPEPIDPVEHAFVDDSEGSELELASVPESVPHPPVSDADGSPFDDLDAHEPAELIELPWRVTGTLDGASVEVWLDPTRETSLHAGGPGGAGRLVLPGLVLDVDLEAQPGEHPRVVLGRDALTGRVRIVV